VCVFMRARGLTEYDFGGGGVGGVARRRRGRRWEGTA